MRHAGSGGNRRRAILVTTGMLAALCALVGGRADAVNFPLGAIVSDNPTNNTPHVLDGRVYAIARAGDRVIVGGTFTRVMNAPNGAQLTRNRIFSYSHSTGLVDTAFTPVVDGEVNSLAVSADGNFVFMGGRFLTVNGVASRGITKVSVTTGARDTGFVGRVGGGVVYDMARAGNSVYLGGNFTTVNGTARGRLGAVDANTGALLPLNLPVTNPRGTSLVPRIEKLDVDTANTRLIIIGNFLAVAGLARAQLAVIDVTTGPPSVANWDTNAYAATCASAFTTYMRDVDISANGAYFVVNTTGAWRGTTTMCDTSARWEMAQTGGGLQPTWVDYTGGDTLYAAAVTDAAVYVGGHQRWHNNATPSRGDVAGPGAVARPGIAALDPLTGVPLSWNPGKDRGVGTFAITATSDSLHIGSDTNFVAGERHPRLATFPLNPGSRPNPAPDDLQLPVNLYRATAAGVERFAFDGAAPPAPSPVQTTTAWSGARGSFVQRGNLYSRWSDGSFTRRPFAETTLGTPVTNLLTLPGYVVGPPNNLSAMRALAYDDGRLFYLRTNDSRLWWRWFSIESGIVASQEFIASSASWTDVTALAVAGNRLYATQTDGQLYQSTLTGPLAGARTVLDSSTRWLGTTALFATQAAGAAAPTRLSPNNARVVPHTSAPANRRVPSIVPGGPGPINDEHFGDVEIRAGEA